MRICRWCGQRLSWWGRLTLRRYCAECGHAVDFDRPSPPCPYMSRLPEAGQ